MTDAEILENIVTLIDQADDAKNGIFDHDGYISGRDLDIFHKCIGELVGLSAYTPVQLVLPRNISDDGESIQNMISVYNRFKMSMLAANAKFGIELARNDGLVSFDALDLSELQELIDSARKILGNATFLSDDHRDRLLARLELLQAETHKVRSDMDRALAGLVEVGDAVGKFGTKAKPIADLFEQIVNVFNRNKKEPLQLPSPPKQIEDKTSETE